MLWPSIMGVLQEQSVPVLKKPAIRAFSQCPWVSLNNRAFCSINENISEGFNKTKDERIAFGRDSSKEGVAALGLDYLDMICKHVHLHLLMRKAHLAL
ncbi:unnamed protein product [Pieris macdunnoughi]|uniref:Uncharacterized protein n=1 Tax=Pieris macdunnoughi TaxID=345717 RepID=A0A821SW79_9NEOP|nr:unnamed protein product [Pieris macdunnoughi]